MMTDSAPHSEQITELRNLRFESAQIIDALSLSFVRSVPVTRSSRTTMASLITDLRFGIAFLLARQI